MQMIASIGRTLRFALALAAGLAAAALALDAQAEGFVNTDSSGVAIQGYDPVAYFTEGQPVKGSPAHTAEWEGAVWHFASAANRDAFLAAPEKYAPQYGGWCAYGATQGYAADTDPVDAWTLRDGKLYLNWDAAVKKQWSEDIPGNLAISEANWPAIKSGLLDGTATVYRK
jgi:YHS domain-containing protein